MTFPASLRDASSAEVGGCTRSVVICNAPALAALRPGQWLSLLNRMNQVERKLAAAYAPPSTVAYTDRPPSRSLRRSHAAWHAVVKPSVVRGRQRSSVVAHRRTSKLTTLTRPCPSSAVAPGRHRRNFEAHPYPPNLPSLHPIRRPTSGGASRLGPDGRTSSRRSRV